MLSLESLRLPITLQHFSLCRRNNARSWILPFRTCHTYFSLLVSLKCPTELSQHVSGSGRPARTLLPKRHKKRMGKEDRMLLIFLKKLFLAVFLQRSFGCCLPSGGLQSLSLSWASSLSFPWRSLSLLGQILHPTGSDFLASTTGTRAFPVQVPDTDLQGTLPWAPSPWCGSFGSPVHRQKFALFCFWL